MRHQSARAAARITLDLPHILLGSPMNVGTTQHARAQEVISQRTGKRPLRFTGALIAGADHSFAP
jgi:hypothetical protein